MKRLLLPPGHAVRNGRVIRTVANEEEGGPPVQMVPMPSIPRPSRYRVIAVSLFEQDIRILDAEVVRGVAAGYPANRSSVVRMALRHFALTKARAPVLLGLQPVAALPRLPG